MPTDACFPYLGPLSFFNSHPSYQVSFSFFALRESDRVHSENARLRVTGRSRACVLYRFQILPRVFIAMAGLLAAGFDLAPFRKNVKMYVLPQDHGALARHSILYNFYFVKNFLQTLKRPFFSSAKNDKKVPTLKRL